MKKCLESSGLEKTSKLQKEQTIERKKIKNDCHGRGWERVLCYAKEWKCNHRVKPKGGKFQLNHKTFLTIGGGGKKIA